MWLRQVPSLEEIAAAEAKEKTLAVNDALAALALEDPQAGEAFGLRQSSGAFCMGRTRVDTPRRCRAISSRSASHLPGNA